MGGRIQYGDNGLVFSNPFSSWQKFLRQFGYPIEWLYNQGKRFVKWAESDPNNNPQPVAKTTTDSTRTKTQEKVNKMISDSREGVKAIQKDEQSNTVVPAKEAPAEVPAAPSKYKGYFAENGFDRYQSRDARMKWINDNKQQLINQGFDVNGYTGGTAAQNANLLRMLKKFASSAQPSKEAVVNQKTLDKATNAPYVAPNATLTTTDNYTYYPGLLYKHGGKIITKYI